MSDPDGWDGGWEAHAARRRRAWAATTPLQRLRWLEEAIEFAGRVGALPREPQAPGDSRGTPAEPPSAS